MPDTPLNWFYAGLFGTIGALLGYTLPTVTTVALMFIATLVISFWLLDLIQTRGPKLERRGQKRAPWLWQAPFAGALAGVTSFWLSAGGT